MPKKKKYSRFRLPWLAPLFIGIALGIASQRIPELRNYTENVVPKTEYRFKQESSVSTLPVSSFHIDRPGYSLAYDARNRNPAWVYEHLTAEGLKGSANRAHSQFKEDEIIPTHLRASLADYKGSGFDRGHMAPAADHKATIKSMNDTFYLTNMCPQCPELNRGYWAEFEKHVRNLTSDNKNVYVFTGPLYLPYTDFDNGERYVKYKVIGDNDVAVPTHFFKVITTENLLGGKTTTAYILPNKKIPDNTPLEKFRTTVQRVEKAAGILFTKPKGK